MDISRLAYLIRASQGLGFCSRLPPDQTSFVFPEVACLEVGCWEVITTALPRWVLKDFFLSLILNTRNATTCALGAPVVLLPADPIHICLLVGSGHHSHPTAGEPRHRDPKTQIWDELKPLFCLPCPQLVLRLLDHLSPLLYTRFRKVKKSHTCSFSIFNHGPSMTYYADSRRRGELRAHHRHLTSKLKR